MVSECGEAFITAQQQTGVAATAKHFPGLGSATKSQNTDNGPVTLTVSLAKLHSIDEVPYPAAIGVGVKLVMVSWAIYPALDATLPAGLSPTVSDTGRVQRRGEPGDRPAREPVLSSLSYGRGMTAWGNLPPALPPHGTVLAWARGCRCEECEREYERFMFELALRGPVRLPATPEPRKLDADTRARLEPAVSQFECPVCGALPHQRCRNLAFPQHFAPTHPERGSPR